MAYLLLSSRRRTRRRSKYAMLWVGVGLTLGVFALVPDVLVPISDWVGISYEPATFFLAAIAFLFLVIVQFSWELSRLEERTRSLAEELALLRAELGGEVTASGSPEPDDG
ncbi:MAG: DUF2304 domain-containing protein [Actinomycetota bacterium]